MKHTAISRVLSTILILCLCATLFCGLAPFASAEQSAADLWTQIEELRDGVLRKGGKSPTTEDFAAISDDIYALVERSGTAIPGSLQAKGDFICWRDIGGIPCCYSPAHEADKAAATTAFADKGAPEELLSVISDTRAATRSGAPSSRNIGLIQPYYRDSSNYYDDAFTSYSPKYLQQATALADKTGGSLIRYTLEDATLGTIAATLESCGMVIFDSHGGTDYSNGDDSTSRANCSYLWLSSGYDNSSDFRSHWSEFLSHDEYYGSHTGPYGTYDDVYLSSDGSYCVSGQLIANHMTKNAPHSFLYMGICLGMATDGMHAPLRAKGVESVYGYSQSVTFSGEVKYMQSITNSLISGKTVSEAVAAAKNSYGDWDPGYYYYTLSQAKSNYVAFPIVVSSEDTYPGHGNVDDLQTVYSTWTLLPRYAVTATVNDSSLGTVSVSATTITASPIDGYYVQSAEVISGSGSCTVHGNTIDVNPQSPCTVLVTFAPKPQVTLTLVGASPITGMAGSTVTLPAGEAREGLDFVGWTATHLDEESTESPEYYEAGSSYTLPYTNTTLYALYTYVDESVVIPITPRYVRVAPGDDFASVVGTGNRFLIAVDLGSLAFVFNGGLSTPYGADNYEYVDYVDDIEGILPANSTTNGYAVWVAPMSGSTGKYSMRLKNGTGSYVKSNKAIGITTTSSPYALTFDTSLADRHYIRDASYTSYRFMMHDFDGDDSYYFGFTNDAAYLTVIYRYEDKIYGQRYYLTNGESCPHTSTELIGASAPTCTVPGETGRTVCTDCGCIVTASVQIPPLGHLYEYAVTTAPTTSAAGTLTGTCTREGCDSTVTVKLPKLNKTDYTYEVITAATCLETGTARYTWNTTTYGTYYFDVTLAALGHNYVYSVTKNPSFTAEGTVKATCKRCGDVVISAMPPFNKTDYDYEVLTEPTCTVNGTARYSKVYGNTRFLFKTQLSALGHDYIDHEAQAPTCTEIGWDAYQTCSRCDYSTYHELSALEHDMIPHEAQVPTCTEPGWIAYESCSRCDYSTYQELPATGHDIIEHEAQPATCTEIGWDAYQTCSRCDYTTYQELPALGHDFADGTCRCGEELKIISASLRLNENINMVYAVKLPEGTEDPYMVFSFLGTERTVTDYTINSAGQYCFELADINPQCMGDNITATLHATFEGTEYTDTVADYSVRDYCINQYAKTEDANLKTLLSDILAYGAAAQTYVDYKTDALVTKGLDLTPSTFESLSGKTVSFTGEQDKNTCWTGAALVLSNDLATRFNFVTDSTDGLTIEVTINGRTQNFDTFENADDGKYCITFDGIQATEFDDTVTATFYRNGAQLGAAVNYSVNTYICSTQNSTNEPLAALVKVLCNYGASANAYAAK